MAGEVGKVGHLRPGSLLMSQTVHRLKKRPIRLTLETNGVPKGIQSICAPLKHKTAECSLGAAMVGIPGRSKACSTCRRRKKGVSLLAQLSLSLCPPIQSLVSFFRCCLSIRPLVLYCYEEMGLLLLFRRYSRLAVQVEI